MRHSFGPHIRAQDRTVCEKICSSPSTCFMRRAATTMVCNIIACIDPLAIQHQNEKTGKCYHPYTSLPGSLYHTVKQNGKTLKNWAHILARLGPRCRLQMKGLLGVGSHTSRTTRKRDASTYAKLLQRAATTTQPAEGFNGAVSAACDEECSSQ